MNQDNLIAILEQSFTTTELITIVKALAKEGSFTTDETFRTFVLALAFAWTDKDEINYILKAIERRLKIND